MLATVSLSLSSCSAILTGLYGIKKLKVLDEKTIQRYAKKYNIPENECYELNKSYISFLKSSDTLLYKQSIINHTQPLQALYYDKWGKLSSFQVNCYAGGFPNLQWNQNDIMTVFPPKEQAPLDTLISLQKHLEFLQPLFKNSTLAHINYDYVVIVYWNRFMGRQSKRFIEYVQENVKLALDKKVKIYYVNSDNVLANI